MEIASFIFSVLGFIFGLLGFVAASITAVIVLGWKNSTHRIEYQKPEDVGPTRYEIDAPPGIVDQLPSSPEPQSLEQWVRSQRSQADDLYEQDLGS